jgi:hypothetical protein
MSILPAPGVFSGDAIVLPRSPSERSYKINTSFVMGAMDIGPPEVFVIEKSN